MSAKRDRIRREIAAIAARLVVDNGQERAQARRKAADAVLGPGNTIGGVMPDEEQLDAALQEHLRIFGDVRQREELHRLRRQALAWMEFLAPFSPHLVGPVLTELATRHTPITLNLYTDSAKDVEMRLLDRGVDFGVEAGATPMVQERIGILLTDEPGACDALAARLILNVLYPNALRVEAGARADLPAVRALVASAGAAQLTCGTEKIA